MNRIGGPSFPATPLPLTSSPYSGWGSRALWTPFQMVLLHRFGVQKYHQARDHLLLTEV